jgi:serine phosphatase RsbU (regulator of sigma subunit)
MNENKSEQNDPLPDTDTTRIDEGIRTQNELLKAQLMNASMINELTKVLHSCTDLEGIIKTVLLAIQEILEFDRVVLFKIDAEDFKLKPGSWVGVNDTELKDLEIPLGFEGGEITDALFLNRHIIIEEPDVSSDPFCKTLHSPSYLVIPVVNKANRKCWEAKSCTKTSCPAHGSYNPYCWSILGSGQLIGAGTEDEKRKACLSCPCFKAEGVFWMDRVVRRTPVTSDDITTLTAIISVAGIVIENFRILNDLDKANNSLHKANEQLKVVNRDLQVAQARIRSDLEHARTIQQGLLPRDIEDNPDFKLGARYFSADAVGGDYYDVFQIAPSVYGLVVADVSGHGIASALIMSMAKVLLKTFAVNEQSPQKTLERINSTFLSDIKTDNFVTIFYAVVDTQQHTVRYTSAGHCPILFLNRSTNTCNQIKADGLFMGVFPDMMLAENKYTYVPDNDRLILYTDGLVEAKNADEEMYGVERLVDISMKTIKVPAKQAVLKILADQNAFCKNPVPEDDITLLVIDL